MLSTVFIVCRVEKTRCPVSANFKAENRLSSSLISPKTIISGSCLSELFKAFSKLSTSVPNSLCMIKAFLFSKIYSMGSSIVKILMLLFPLNFSIILARVVDLPLPVIPLIKTKPSFRAKIFSSISLLINSPFNFIASSLISLITKANFPFVKKEFYLQEVQKPLL